MDGVIFYDKIETTQDFRTDFLIYFFLIALNLIAGLRFITLFTKNKTATLGMELKYMVSI